MNTVSHILSLTFLVVWIASCGSSSDNKQMLVPGNVRILSPADNLAYVDGLLEKDPQIPELLIKKAQILFEMGLYDQASEALGLIDEDYGQMDYELLKIKVALKRNALDTALMSAEALFQNSNIESIALNEQLALLYAAKKDYLKAIDHINYCIEKNEGNPEYTYLKGLYYYNFKDTLNAYTYIEKALNSGYNELNAIILYADLLMASERFGEALKWINGYLLRYPGNPELRNSLAKVFNLQGDYRRSKEISKGLLKEGYQGYEPYLNMANLYLDTYRYDSAIYFAERALQINNQINEGYYILGRAHRAKEEVYNAYNAYSKVLEYDPGDPHALSEMRKLENYIAYLQRIRREYESRPVVPTLKPKSID